METISVGISSVGAVSMIQDNFAIFRTNCVIARGLGAPARTYCEDFCGCRAGKMASEFFMLLAHNSIRLTVGT